MSDISKLRKCRAYVKGSNTSTLNQLEGLCDPKAAAAAAKPSETLVKEPILSNFPVDIFLLVALNNFWSPVNLKFCAGD